MLGDTLTSIGVELDVAIVSAKGLETHRLYFEFDAPDGLHALLGGRFPKARAELVSQF